MPTSRWNRGGAGRSRGHRPSRQHDAASASSASIRPDPHPTSTSVPSDEPDGSTPPSRTVRYSGSPRSLPRANSHAVMLPATNRSEARRTSEAKKRILSSIACQHPGRTADGQAEDRPDDDRTNQEVGAHAPRIDPLDGFDRQRPQLAPPDERACLKLGQDQERRHERVGDVRGQIQLDAVQAQQRACRQADREMEAVEGQTSDEHAQADGCRVSSRPAPFGSEVVHESTRISARHGRTAGDARTIAEQDAGAALDARRQTQSVHAAGSHDPAPRCPSAVTSPSIL